MQKKQSDAGGGLRLQILGTASWVGKSVIAAAFCRIFLQDGFRPCPFKAQNMALNSFVTRRGEEIGRSQAVQAQAARLEPTADMNPILIKPMEGHQSQIIVRGYPLGKNMGVKESQQFRKKAQSIVLDSFARLSDQYDIIVLEGAGSPAEPNLKQRDIVNIRLARLIKAPVILVGDIDRGGVFAWFVGTLELLTKKERDLVRGYIINKFRGEKKSLKPAIRDLEKRTGKKVLGIVPFFRDIRIPEEDSVFLNAPKGVKGPRAKADLDIAIVRFPHLSNFTDFDALEREPDVRLRYIAAADEWGRPDVLILPGTKSTVQDLCFLRKTSLDRMILEAARNRPALQVIGICGGFQMMGKKIVDQEGTESSIPETEGLGLLPVVTEFGKEKILAQVQAEEIASGLPVRGYEIHHGVTRILGPCRPVFRVVERRGRKVRSNDGVSVADGRIWGTYLHGVFDADEFRRDFLNRIRKDKGLGPCPVAVFNTDLELDKLADLVRSHVDMKAVYAMLREQH